MKLRYTNLELLIEMIGFVFIVGIFGYLFIVLGSLPQEIVIHFNGEGIADQWGDKMQIFKLPLMGLLIYGFATVVSFFPRFWNVGIEPTHKNAEKIFRFTKDMILFLKTEIAICFAYAGFMYANQRPLAAWFLPLFIVLVFGTIIYFMIRTSRAKKDGFLS